MFVESACQCTAPIKGHARGDAEVREAFAPHSKRERVLEGLKPRQKSVGLDHDPRACRGGARLLEFADETIHIDRAALVQTPYADVGIDHHDGFNMSGQTLEQ